MRREVTTSLPPMLLLRCCPLREIACPELHRGTSSGGIFVRAGRVALPSIARLFAFCLLHLIAPHEFKQWGDLLSPVRDHLFQAVEAQDIALNHRGGV